MEKEKNSFEALFEKANDYLETRIELTKLKAVDKASDFVSSLTAKLIILFFIVIILLFASIATAFLIGNATGGLQYGFFIVAGFYLLLVLLLYIFRRQWLKTPILNSIIKSMLK